MRSSKSVDAAPSWRRRLGHVLGVSALVVAGGLGGMPVPSASLGIAAAVAADQVVRSKPRIEAELMRTLESGKPTRYAVYFERPDLSRAYSMDWQTRGRYVFDTLKAEAERYQQPLREHMTARGYVFQSFWVDNMMLVENGDIALFNDLASFSGVKHVRTIPEVKLIKPEQRAPGGISAPPGPVPNLVRVKAVQAWASGAQGQGIVVANIDSGVRFSHEALRGKYRGNLGGGTYDHNYNFHNPYGTTIGDSDSHGTHVMGTIVGGTATQTIGIAPEATWIACRGFNPSATDAGLLGCAQWVAAPTNSSGGGANPDLRPHVVNNSWGDCGRSYDNWYEGVVSTWRAAGIFPVFANGNASNCSYSAPPGLNTVGNPGRYGSVFGVGSSSNNTGTYATHSNWGPTDSPSLGLPNFPDHGGFPNLKPNVVAPGVNILSSVSSSDTAYQSSGYTGTSMSSPHVAGLIAVMWSVAPCLLGDYATTGSIIQQTTVPIPYNSGGSPAPGAGNVPNYATGWGEIDAEAATAMAVSMCGPQGIIAGVVTDAGDSSALDAVQVVLENPNPPPPTYQVSTAVDGSYSRQVSATVPGEGTYTARFSRFGYLPETVSGIEVTGDATTTVNVAMERAPAVTVSGVVTDSLGGWPLYARIDIGGYPFGAIYTDPVTGAYEVDLPAGTEYTFSVSAVVAGYNSESQAVDTVTLFGAPSQITLDVDLDAILSTCVAPGYEVESFSSESFEAGNGGYTVTESAALWQWGTPSAWPSSCVSGTKCWGTNLSGNYPNNVSAELLSPVIAVGAYTGPLSVLWQQANHIETHTYDKAFVEVRINGGTWQEAWRNPTSTVAQGWQQRRFDIPAFPGGDLQVRFRFSSDGSTVHPGLYIDDVTIANPTCSPRAGSYVSGIVTDANTAVPLNGVSVTVGDAPTVVTAANQDASEQGFYQAWAEAGSQIVAAELARHASATASVSVVNGQNQRVNLALTSASLSLSSTNIVKAVELGQSDSEVISVINSGTADAEVSLVVGSPKQNFESAFPPAGWSVQNAASATGGCGWKRNDAWGVGNLAGGDGFSAVVNADACGSGTTTDSFLISPTLDLAGNTLVSLRFMLAYRNLGATDSLSLQVSRDDGATWANVNTYTASVSAQGPGELQTFDLSSQLGGAAGAKFRFRYVGGWAWWAHVDQVEVSTDGVAWLDISPSANIPVPANGSANITLDFSTASLSSVGSYSTQLSVVHDTPSVLPPASITMNVTAPASFGQVVGTVTSAGYCGLASAPIANAELTLTGSGGSYTTTTDASGDYALFLDASEGPLDISVTAPGHAPGSATAVAVVASGQTTQDFALDALLGCTTLSPASPSFNVTLRTGGTETHTVQLDNAGLASAAFTTSTRAPSVTVNLVGASGNAPRAVNAGLRVARGTPFQSREAQGVLRGAGTRVLLLSPDDPAAGGTTPPPTPSGLLNLLNALPEIDATLFPAANLPGITSASLTGYDVVLVLNNTKWLDAAGVAPAVVGNALADYVDGGGKVILANFAHDNTGWELGGRLITGGYSPFNMATGDVSGTFGLGTVLVADHPVMDGITTVQVSSTSVALQTISVKSTATRIANWSNGQPLVAVNADESVVAVNFLAGDAGATGSFSWTGQVPELLRNTAVYLSGGGFSADWLSFNPESGSVAADDSTTVELVFTALPELEPGTYEAVAVIRVDDGGGNTPSFDIPVTLTIQSDTIFSDGFEPSP